MYITLEVQHAVKPGREQEVIALLKQYGNRPEQFSSTVCPELFVAGPVESVAVGCDPVEAKADRGNDWCELFQAPARIKVRMSV